MRIQEGVKVMLILGVAVFFVDLYIHRDEKDRYKKAWNGFLEVVIRFVLIIGPLILLAVIFG